MSESKPSDDASLWLQGTVKTGVYQVLRDKSGRNLLTNPAAVGEQRGDRYEEQQIDMLVAERTIYWWSMKDPDQTALYHKLINTG
jgi:hypothetical protein